MNRLVVFPLLIGWLGMAAVSTLQAQQATQARGVGGLVEYAPGTNLDPHAHTASPDAVPPQVLHEQAVPVQETAPGESAMGRDAARQTHAVLNDANWDSRFGLAGVDGVVNAMEVSGGTLYVGGSFVTAGGVTVNGIARWNGTTWSALGSGVNGPVFAVAVVGSNVYVGGRFTEAGGVAVNNIARWNGSSWSALGSGVQGGGSLTTVYAIEPGTGGSIYVGGYFATAGAVSSPCIAQWTGAAWAAVGGGLSSAVYALAVNGADVYAGGRFLNAGATAVNRVARFSGGTWSPLGSGVNDDVFALAYTNSTLYAGGRFTQAGGSAAGYVAAWNGSWASLAGGGTNGPVFNITPSGARLYIGGTFTQAGGGSRLNVATWLSSWSSLGSGVTGEATARGVFAMAIGSGTDWGISYIFAGGGFRRAGSVHVSGVGAWSNPNGTGLEWVPLGGATKLGADEALRALVTVGGTVYAAGYFTAVGGVAAQRVAAWNGSAWSALGSGITDGAVLAMAAGNGGLYVGGTFTRAGSGTANRIAFWNGSSWSALGSGVGGVDFAAVYAIAVSGSNVYVGGAFTTAGGVTVNGIARWNGSSWSALGSGVQGGVVLALAVNGPNVYVGGSFDAAGGTPAKHVAHWSGSAWFTMGAGTNDDVHALAYGNNFVYAGGSFTMAGSVTANRVARWNGVGWQAMGNGMNGDAVTALAPSGTAVYAGGSFTTAGSGPANRVARWNGVGWEPLGSGTSGPVRALTLMNEEVYVGGYFRFAGTKPSSFIGKYGTTPGDVLGCPLNQGWNMASSYVDPTDPAMASVMSGIQASLEIVTDNLGTQYWPSQNIFNLSTWDVTEGYNIYMNNAATLTFVGTAVAPDLPVSLSQGWNMIPYLKASPLATGTAVASIAGQFILIKDNLGVPYWPDQSIFSLAQLEPCQGYMVYMTSAATLRYPASGALPKQTVPITEVIPARYYVDVPARTGSSALLLVEAPALADGSEVGVWTAGDRLVGSGVVSAGRTLVTVWGDNLQTSVVEAARPGEPLRLTYWDAVDRAEWSLSLNTVVHGLTSDVLEAEALTYVHNGVWIVEAGNPAEVPDRFGLEQNYPNPFNPATLIRYTLAETADVRLEVFNALGQRVAVLVEAAQEPGRHEAAFQATDLPSGAYVYRLQAGGKTMTKKMMLLR